MTITPKSEEIALVKMGRPHVVILGAGASIAATRPFGGDKSGKRLPGMIDFVDTLGIQDILDKADVLHSDRNFEDIYDEIFQNLDLISTRIKLENAVHDYFSDMRLPDEPTAYDHLVMSLRGKDIIATFNWDPFLVQAIQRNSVSGMKTPTPLFLHGNVCAGYCVCKKFFGPNGTYCRKCGKPLVASKLLYPIKDKDYASDFFISTQWEILRQELELAFMVSIFGYGAPSSDVNAVQLMLSAWGSPARKNMEQFEIINILPEEELHDTWSPFIHSHHYEIHKNLADSWIGKHPRRTGEAYWNQYMEVQYIDDNKPPNFSTFAELWDWYAQFKPAEEAAIKEFR